MHSKRLDTKASPVRRLWAQMTSTPSLIDFDDEVAGEVVAQRHSSSSARRQTEPPPVQHTETAASRYAAAHTCQAAAHELLQMPMCLGQHAAGHSSSSARRQTEPLPVQHTEAAASRHAPAHTCGAAALELLKMQMCPAQHADAGAAAAVPAARLRHRQYCTQNLMPACMHLHTLAEWQRMGYRHASSACAWVDSAFQPHGLMLPSALRQRMNVSMSADIIGSTPAQSQAGRAQVGMAHGTRSYQQGQPRSWPCMAAMTQRRACQTSLASPGIQQTACQVGCKSQMDCNSVGIPCMMFTCSRCPTAATQPALPANATQFLAPRMAVQGCAGLSSKGPLLHNHLSGKEYGHGWRLCQHPACKPRSLES